MLVWLLKKAAELLRLVEEGQEDTLSSTEVLTFGCQAKKEPMAQ